jgi:hypothetical protein
MLKLKIEHGTCFRLLERPGQWIEARQALNCSGPQLKQFKHVIAEVSSGLDVLEDRTKKT